MKQYEITNRTLTPRLKTFNPRMVSTGMHGCEMTHFEQGLTETTEVMWGCTQGMQELHRWVSKARGIGFKSVTHNMRVLG